MNDTALKFTPTEFIAVVNQTLEGAYNDVYIVGEVASFKVNQGKWVFFDLKDAESSVSCFMPVWELRTPLEDGMKVMIVGTPKLAKWGKFSVTVRAVKPVGEGSLKKAYEMLKKKLTAEGLFAVEKKRKIPERISRLGVISSTQAAGYADFIKIINARWGGIKVSVAHTQVQGMVAADQIIRALNYFNERGEVEVVAILRGGGSADDLSCFNDEQLVRAIAASKIPVITGIGHEVDESLADLAADVRASTPSNAAEILTRDRVAEMRRIVELVKNVGDRVCQRLDLSLMENRAKVERVSRGVLGRFVEPELTKLSGKILRISTDLNLRFIDPKMKEIQEHRQIMWRVILEKYNNFEQKLEYLARILTAMNPEKVLMQGYAIITGKISPGSVVKITTSQQEVEAEIKKITERN